MCVHNCGIDFYISKTSITRLSVYLPVSYQFCNNHTLYVSEYVLLSILCVFYKHMNAPTVSEKIMWLMYFMSISHNIFEKMKYLYGP